MVSLGRWRRVFSFAQAAQIQALLLTANVRRTSEIRK